MGTRQSVIHSDPRKSLAALQFSLGLRVPAQALIDYLEAGHPLDEFLDDFPSVTREQAVATLEQAKQILVSSARAAGWVRTEEVATRAPRPRHSYCK
jgi:Protein of unknown function (DUF433)